MEDVMAKTILTELREFRQENNKRWEENDKRWEQNERRWRENDKRWEENERRWKENDKRWEQNDKRWLDSEKQREKDRKELFDVLDNMDKSISKGLNYMEKYIDDRCRKLEDEHFECRKNCLLLSSEMNAQKSRLNFQNVRIESLEKWRNNLGDDFVGIN